MEHYYTSPEKISPSSLKITGDEAKHLTKVLRKEKGNEIFVTDGTGNLFTCVIESISKKDITCQITGKQKNLNEPVIKLTAYIALLKNPSRYEFAIEKLTELGVYEIQPIITERVISKGKDKTGRWQSIALSAMKQSQRCWLPKVGKPVHFKESVKSCMDEIKLLAHEKAALTPLPPLLKDSGSRLTALSGLTDKKGASLFIGPEGGFTNDEIKFAAENGFKVISFGSRKIRSETAAIVGAALILM